MTWRAGGHCPLDGCHFAFIIESVSESEIDVVGAAIMQAHSDISHEGIPTSLLGFPSSPTPLPEDAPTQEETNLLNHPAERRLVN